MVARHCCSVFCCFCRHFVLIWGYLTILWHFQRSYIWSWVYDWDAICHHEPLPANQTGLKVLVAGFAKTGTWAVTAHLKRIGLTNTYHGQEFMGHIWTHIANEFWMRPENGARRPRVIHPFNIQYLQMGEYWRTGIWPVSDFSLAADGKPVPPNSSRFPNDDLMVLADLKAEKLAAYASRCRVDSVAFDGTDSLYWPLYEVSPNVRVILLDWRPYESWRDSMRRFGLRWLTLISVTNLLWSAAHGLPWGFFLQLIDPWIGCPIDDLLRTGGAFLHYAFDPPIMAWVNLAYQTRIFSHFWGGLGRAFVSEDDYHTFYEQVRRRTPPENLFKWNVKSSTYEELCGFLNITDCPATGVPEHVPNSNSWEKLPIGDTIEPGMLIPFYMFFHFVNWKVYRALVRIMAFACRALLLL